MSNVSNRHTVQKFDAKKSVPLTNQRLLKVGYKQTEKMTKAGEIAPDSVCVSVPFISTESINKDQQERLIPHLRGLLESAQDGIVRSLLEASDHTLREVSDDDLSIDSCIAFLDAEAAGDRLKKESILEWFDAVLADNLFVLVAEKLKFTEITPEVQKTVGKHVAVYRDVIGSLAGGKTALSTVQIKNCRTALALTAESNGIGAKLTARLDSMERPKVVAEMIDLGDIGE